MTRSHADEFLEQNSLSPHESPISVLDRASSAFIHYPRLMNLHASIQRCHRLTKKLHDPQCMALEGEPGVGKTTITKMYADAFPRHELAHCTYIPVFYFQAPSPITVKGFATSMLRALGDPLAGRGTLENLTVRLIHYFKVCRIELVIIDDFHHLIDSDTDTILRTVSEWLKVLLRTSHVPLLVVGLEGKAQRILSANKQLSRHFSTCETLMPFRWDSAETMQEFSGFINYAQAAIGIPMQTPLTRSELLRRIHYATAGVVGNIMNLLRYAAVRAEEQTLTHISLTDLAWAYDTRLLSHMGQAVNPFKAARDEPFIAPSPAPEANPNGIRRRRMRKDTKKDSDSVVDVLKT